MRCERVQLAWSERMDGGHPPVAVAEALDTHLETCPQCRAYADGAQRVRELARFTLLEPVPDLIAPIMQRVALEAAPGRARPARSRLRSVGAAEPIPPETVRPETARTDTARTDTRTARRRAPRPRRRRREAFRLGTALIAGAVVGSLVTGTGPGVVPPSTPRAAMAATEIPARVVEAAAAVRTFHATYAVTEWHFRPAVPVRRFTADVWFEAPERFRLDLVDHTAYPSPAWTANNASLVVNGSRWYRSGPGRCPASVYPRCSGAAPQALRIDHRAPFSAAAALPTEAVVPVQALGDSSVIHVVRPGRVLGRPAVEVELPYDRAQTLFAPLHQAGTWRPFHPTDRVDVWLDRSRWVPLRYVVRPDPSPSRARWAARHGLPFEPPSSEIFAASATALDLGPPRPGVFAVPRGPTRSEGATSVLLADLDIAWHQAPVLPEQTAGLDLYRVVVTGDAGAGAGSQSSGDLFRLGSGPSGAGSTRNEVHGTGHEAGHGFVAGGSPALASTHALFSYSRGVTYLNVRERRARRADSEPFGVSPAAEKVSLPGGGSALFDPGSGSNGHHLSLHAGHVDVAIESNLPKEDLLLVAGSLPAARRDVPSAWVNQRSPGGATERVTLDQARAGVPFPIPLPASLPAGYRLASVELVDVAGVRGVTLHFQSDAGSSAIRLHLEEATGLPPASSARQFSVRMRGATGRFTPSRNQLEWVAHGVYVSLDGARLELPSLLSIAGSLRSPPPESAAGPNDDLTIRGAHR